jgi:hypothetical protein
MNDENVIPFPAGEEPEPTVTIRIASQSFRVRLEAVVEETTGQQAEVLELRKERRE